MLPNVLGFSGLDGSLSFKEEQFPNLTAREWRMVQGLDSAAALVSSGHVVAAAAEERFTRQKGTDRFPKNAIRFCLEQGDTNLSEIDVIAHAFSYGAMRSHFEESSDFLLSQYEAVFSPELQKAHLDKHFPLGTSEKLVSVPHHSAHAASAFYLSGFDESLILVSDGMGEQESATISIGSSSGIRRIATVPANHSLGVLYSLFTHHLGFRFNSGEYKVMGLAPYGNARTHYAKINALVHLKDDGLYSIPILAGNHSGPENANYTGALAKLEELFGPARTPEGELTAYHFDIAAGLQAVLQNCQMHLLRHFRAQTGLENLCLAGGVALNCVANGTMLRSSLFKRLFVQPAAGDDGAAIGAALQVQKNEYDLTNRMGLPFWGPEYEDEEIEKVLQQDNGIRWKKNESYDDLAEHVAARIAKGEIIGWFQGRMEFGPRALGNRSILADPRGKEMRERINNLVKKREDFRPFAPAVTVEDAGRYFVLPSDVDAFSTMLCVAPVQKDEREGLPAVTHVDGSARVQTVAEKDNPRFWKLLRAFEKASGIPILLNTSFNVRGQPIVCSPSEAVTTFKDAGLDGLVIGDYLVELSA